VDQVVRYFRAQGASEIEEVEAVTEEVSFALPPELVRDREQQAPPWAEPGFAPR
jgi:hypothetical protein